MPVIHPQTYAKFKPIFLDALKTRTEPGASRTEMMQAIIHQLKDASYTRDDAEDIRPYIELFLEEVQNGTIEPFARARRIDWTCTMACFFRRSGMPRLTAASLPSTTTAAHSFRRS